MLDSLQGALKWPKAPIILIKKWYLSLGVTCWNERVLGLSTVLAMQTQKCILVDRTVYLQKRITVEELISMLKNCLSFTDSGSTQCSFWSRSAFAVNRMYTVHWTQDYKPLGLKLWTERGTISMIFVDFSDKNKMFKEKWRSLIWTQGITCKLQKKSVKQVIIFRV